MNEIGYVYRIVSPCGKVYIGSTLNIDKRKYYYEKCICKNQIKLYRSLLKYGFLNHKFYIIWKGVSGEMLYMESLYGNRYNSLDRYLGLNLKLPYINEKLKSFSEETINKMSLSQKERVNKNNGYVINFTDEIRSKISKKLKGRKQSVLEIENRIKLFNKPVICTKTGKTFVSMKKAAEFLNINVQYFRDMLNGKVKNKTTFIRM